MEAETCNQFIIQRDYSSRHSLHATLVVSELDVSQYGGQVMDPQHAALVLIGYQNDYFATDGVLYRVIEEASRVTGTLANTVDLLEHLVFYSSLDRRHTD